MVKFLHFLFLLLCFLPVRAQEPTIAWGPEILHNNRNLNQLQVIGTSTAGSFYACYTADRQITLERYNQNNQRIWSVAVVPLSPGGERTRFEQLVLLNGQVHVVSSLSNAYEKTVYSQQLDAHGNYLPAIHILGATTPDAAVAVTINQGRMLLILQQQAEPQQTSVALFQGSYQPAWSVLLPVKGNIQDVVLTASGNAFILTASPPTNSPEAAFYLYRFEGRNGRNTMQPIGNTALRPLQARMAALHGDVIVAGLTAPAPFVASLSPEPTGTFYYRFPKGRFRNSVQHYAPIDSVFLQNYKAYKPDLDHSQRLRYLQLQHLLPLAGKQVAMLGEVYTSDKKIHHTDDILIVAFDENGRTHFTTSINKHQSGPVNEVRLGSYIASVAQDTLRLIYLDFEYNYNAQQQLSTANSGTASKTPVLVTIDPAGRQKVRPLLQAQTGQSQDFHLVPAAAYQTGAGEFIVLGAGKGYYKFGRLKF